MFWNPSVFRNGNQYILSINGLVSLSVLCSAAAKESRSQSVFVFMFSITETAPGAFCSFADNEEKTQSHWSSQQECNSVIVAIKS